MKTFMLVNNLCCVFNLPLTKSFFVFTQIMFDNRAHSGKIKVNVENDVRIYECRDWNVEGTCKLSSYWLLLQRPAGGTVTSFCNPSTPVWSATWTWNLCLWFPADKNDYLLLSFDSVVILACFASLILCTRSIINGIQLQFVSYEEQVNGLLPSPLMNVEVFLYIWLLLQLLLWGHSFSNKWPI